MGKKVQPLLSPLDTRRRISLTETARLCGFTLSQTRGYFQDGTIPGARQAAKGKRWTIDRQALEAWWQKYNEGNSKQANG